jgi:hypothetical protein
MVNKVDLIQAYKDLTRGTSLYDKITELYKMGFFTAPASTHYHGAYRGGLCAHSLAVTRQLLKLTESNNLVWERNESPLIVGLFHDLCKCDQYRYDKFEDEYEFVEKTMVKGHGEKSVLLASTLVQLTMEEALCIRYHMGAFTGKEEWDGFTKAVQKYPNVLWTHQADMIATNVEGV